MANTVTVSFKVPPEGYAIIRGIAYGRGFTISRLCRTAVYHALQTGAYWEFLLAELADSSNDQEFLDQINPDLDPEWRPELLK